MRQLILVLLFALPTLASRPSHADDRAFRLRMDAWSKAVGRDRATANHFVNAAAGAGPAAPNNPEEVPLFRASAERVDALCRGEFADLVASPRPSYLPDGDARDAWRMCPAVARRDELLPIMVTNSVRSQVARLAANQTELADKLPANKGWVDTTGTGFAVAWGEGRGHPPWIARLRELCAAAGLPVELVQTSLDEASSGYWLKVEALGKTLVASDAVAHDKALEARAKTSLAKVDASFTAVGAGLHDSDWNVRLDGSRKQPISRSRSGFLVLKRDGEPLCREVVFVVGEHYEGKRWAGHGDDVTFERMRFVACP